MSRVRGKLFAARKASILDAFRIVFFRGTLRGAEALKRKQDGGKRNEKNGGTRTCIYIYV